MSIFKRSEETLQSDLTPTMAYIVGDNSVEPEAPDLQVTKKSNTGKVGVYLFLLIGLIGAIAGIIVFFSGNKNSETTETTQTQTEQTRVANRQPRQFNLELPDTSASSTSEPAEAEAESTIESTEENWQNSYINQSTPVPTEDRRLLGSVLLDFESGSLSSNNRQDEYADSGSNTSLGNRLQPTVTASTHAKRRADLTYLMKKGTNIGCTLDTKIVTTHPGITRCMVTKDVYSADGKVLLVERGSEVIGEQTTSMLHGQAKVFVLWNTINTPHGVTLDIASPSADSLGASGQDAQVDKHFWERFGGAIMLSLIDDGLVIVGDRINRNNSSVSYDSTSDTIESMAAEALRNTINIPPTGYVNQGTLLNIMVARDVDFSPVYELVTPQFF